MRVLMIDPWSYNHLAVYTGGLIRGLNECVNIDFVCNVQYNGTVPNGILYKWYFKKSQEIRTEKTRKILRGFEYIWTWEKILKLISKNDYDVIHIQWLLMYKIDVVFLKAIKKRYPNVRLVLTAHNVLPHIEGKKYIQQLKVVYSVFDSIVVHGEAIREEFLEVFPECEKKIKIQRHGTYLEFDDTSLCHPRTVIEERYDQIRNVCETMFLMFGFHFFNKGTDRLIDIWSQHYSANKSVGLVICGEAHQEYKELKEAKENCEHLSNFHFFDGFISEHELDYMIHNADCIVIPYRHASLSGIIFSAAKHKKTVVCTRCGALAEYLENNVDSIVCDNNENSIFLSIEKAKGMGNEKLHLMGEQLHKNIVSKYNWKTISNNLYQEVYMGEKSL